MASKQEIEQASALRSLIQSAQNGDQDAFEELLDRYTPLIDSMVYNQRIVQDLTVQDCEDHRQEAVLAFYRALMHYDTAQNEVQFGLFAKLCIKNALYSHLRKLKRRQDLLLEDQTGAICEDPEGDPANRVMAEESYLELSRTIHDVLSEYENQIWWLYLSGRTAKEIADHLGRDERSVQNAVYRIRKKLRTVIPYS